MHIVNGQHGVPITEMGHPSIEVDTHHIASSSSKNTVPAIPEYGPWLMV